MRIDLLFHLVSGVCPIESLNSDGVMVFAPSATAEQRDAAEALLALNTTTPTEAEILEEAIKAGLATARQMRETILNRLTGIAGRYQRAGDLGAATACDAAAAALLDITKSPAVLAATSELALKTAILTEYRNIAGGLSVSAPYAVAAFEGYEA